MKSDVDYSHIRSIFTKSSKPINEQIIQTESEFNTKEN